MAVMNKVIAFISNLTSTAIVALAALAGVVVFMKGQQHGKASTIARIERQERRGAEAARSIRSAVRGYSAERVDERLRQEGWMR
jgi:predicted PurR-regulated permease PerM